jgi:hypothetical protein
MRLILAAAIAGLLTSAAHGDEITTYYNLAPGACTKPISVPVYSKPVILAGTDLQNGNRGTGMVSLLRAIGSNDPYLVWAGTDVHRGTETGFSPIAGITMFFLDDAGSVYIQTAPSTHIQVCNSSDNLGNAFGYLTFTY